MNNTPILVLGAGELGMAVLRNLAKRVALFSGTTLAVLLRPSTIASNDPSKQREIAALHSARRVSRTGSAAPYLRGKPPSRVKPQIK